jgi:heme/copper-type cytochrome/quinol oxidase subunit 2
MTVYRYDRNSGRFTRRDLMKGGLAVAAATLAAPYYLRYARAQDGPIKIGFPVPLTGPYGTEAEEQARCAQIAIDEFNAAGGLDGRMAELLVRDDKLDPGEAATRTLELIESDGVNFICGSLSASVQLSVNQVASQRGVIYNSIVSTPVGEEQVRIISQQWSWTFVHAGPDGQLDTGDDIRTVDDLYLQRDRVYRYELHARDVLHSFSVPVFRLKQDAVPGRAITGWFTPTVAGDFDIQCAEICGLGHALMPGRVHVRTAEQMTAWMAEAVSSGQAFAAPVATAAAAAPAPAPEDHAQQTGGAK